MSVPEIRSIHRLRRRHRQLRRLVVPVLAVAALLSTVLFAPGSSAQESDTPAPAVTAADEPTEPTARSVVIDERVELCAAWNAVESTFAVPEDPATAVNALDAALAEPRPPGLDVAIDDMRIAVDSIGDSLDTLAGYVGPICDSLVPVTIDFGGDILAVTGSCLTTPVIGAQDLHYVLNGPDFFGVMTFHTDEDSLFVTVTTEFDVWESSLITTEEFGVGSIMFTEPDDSNPRQFTVDYDFSDVPLEACDNLPVCRDLLAMWDALILLADAQARLEGSTGAAPVEIGAIDEDLGHLANVVTFCLPPTAMSVEDHLAGLDEIDVDS